MSDFELFLFFFSFFKLFEQFQLMLYGFSQHILRNFESKIYPKYIRAKSFMTTDLFSAQQVSTQNLLPLEKLFSVIRLEMEIELTKIN